MPAAANIRSRWERCRGLIKSSPGAAVGAVVEDCVGVAVGAVVGTAVTAWVGTSVDDTEGVVGAWVDTVVFLRAGSLDISIHGSLARAARVPS